MGGAASKSGESSSSKATNTTSAIINAQQHIAKQLRESLKTKVSAGAENYVAESGEDEALYHAAEAVRVVINNDGTRRAFIKYLQSIGLDVLLNFYFEVEELKSSGNGDIPLKLKELRVRYLFNKPLPSSDALAKWKSIVDKLQSLDPSSTDSLPFENAQEQVILILFSSLPEFNKSEFYTDWTKFRQEQEHAAFGRGKTADHIQTNPSSKITSFAPPSPRKPAEPICTFPDKFSNVLVIDDSAVAAKLTTLALKRNGHIIKIATNGRKGIELTRQEKFDLILVDLYMPVMDGFETLACLRAPPSSCDKPPGAEVSNESNNQANVELKDNHPTSGISGTIIIGMSADGNDATVAKAISSGADYFMEKPFTAEKLNFVLLQALNKKV